MTAIVIEVGKRLDWDLRWITATVAVVWLAGTRTRK